MTLALVFALALVHANDAADVRGSRAESPLLVRFTCDELELAQRMERRTWSSAIVAAELARGWVSVRWDACEHERAFERWLGERGSLAACVIGRDGALLGVLPGFADARRCAAFLRDCRELEDTRRRVPECGHDSAYLASVDARLALGVRAPLVQELECALHASDALHAHFAERLARLHALQGEPRLARRALELAVGCESEGEHGGEHVADATLDARSALTCALIALLERDSSAAASHAHALASHASGARLEAAATLRLARELHEAGADDPALELAAALESLPHDDSAQRDIDALREHVLLSPTGHTH